MSFNQQLREPRVLAILNPRVIALMAFVAAALIAAGCKPRLRRRCHRVSRPHRLPRRQKALPRTT